MRLLAWSRILLALALFWGAAPESSAQKKKTSQATSKSKAKSKKTAKRRTRATTARRTYRTSQQKPAPERYAEIQRALADKGYFEGTPDGAWSDSSVQALKRFQEDQNLKADGKLNSLSLIALGLGPKRTPFTAGAAPPAEPK